MLGVRFGVPAVATAGTALLLANYVLALSVAFANPAAAFHRPLFMAVAHAVFALYLLFARHELGARVRPGDVVLLKGRDTQRLDRIALKLLGRDVRCTRVHCDLNGFSANGERCAVCPALEVGFDEAGAR